MSRDLVSPDLILAQEARVLTFGTEVARLVDAHGLASEVNDGARHGKPGTVRSPNAVYVWRVSKRLHEVIAGVRSRSEKQQQDRQSYAKLYVDLFQAAAQQQASPRRLGNALRTLRSHGYPNLNPDLADRLLALGDSWPSQGLPAAPPREMTRPRRTRAPREGRRARAVSKSAR